VGGAVARSSRADHRANHSQTATLPGTPLAPRTPASQPDSRALLPGARWSTSAVRACPIQSRRSPLWSFLSSRPDRLARGTGSPATLGVSRQSPVEDASAPFLQRSVERFISRPLRTARQRRTIWRLTTDDTRAVRAVPARTRFPTVRLQMAARTCGPVRWLQSTRGSASAVRRRQPNAPTKSPLHSLNLPQASVASNCVDWLPFQQKSFDAINRPVSARKWIGQRGRSSAR
jgi:hypothetical protein